MESSNFNNFFETIEDIILVTDMTARVIHMNKAAAEKTGYSAEELSGQLMSGIFNSTKGNEPEHIFSEMISGIRKSCNLQLICKDGTFLPVETRIWTGYWNGRDCLFSISKDLLKEEEALQKLNKIFGNIPALVAVLDYPGRSFTEVNEAFLSTSGFSRDEVIGKTVDHLHLIADQSKYADFISLLGTNRKVLDFEVEAMAKDGTKMNFLMSGEIIENQGKQFILVVLTNITTRKRLETEFYQQSKLQEILMKIASQYINLPVEEIDHAIRISLEELGKFTGADRTYIFEYDWIKNICNNTYEWCDEDVEPQIDELQEVPVEMIPEWTTNHRLGKTMFIPDVFALPEDDGVRQILEPQDIKSLIAIPMMKDQECVGFVGFDSVKKHHNYSERERTLLTLFAQMLVNVHMRKTMQLDLIESNKAAEAASKAKSEFLANMSHEIRTPLNAVIGFTDLLLNTGLNDLQNQYAKNANLAGKTLLGIIDDILDFSKIEAGKLELEIRETDITELMEQTVDIVKYHAGAKNVELLLNIPPGMPGIIEADHVRLKQILINLMNNAVKFTRKGEVELKAEFSETSEHKGRYTFSVRDTGIGINDEQREKLFKAFSQADNSTTRKFGGTGLGLIISNLLAKKMGSHIEVQSEFGKGSCFYFTLETTCRSDKPVQPSGSIPVRKVLVIDDNDNNRLILEKNLTHWGIEFQGAENGMKALRLIENNEFDLVITDYSMPFMNGIETIKNFREKKGLTEKELPVILLHSSADDKEIKEAGEKLGILFTLVKPVKINELHSILSKIRRDPGQVRQVSAHDENSGSSKTANFTILIAEDVAMNMIMVKALVKMMIPGVTILEARNGKEAVRIFMENNISLVLMDIMMPEMDGIDATRQIRKYEEEVNIHVPVIALTAGALLEEKEKAFKAGMDDFLTKPIEPEKLKHIFTRYL